MSDNKTPPPSAALSLYFVGLIIFSVAIFIGSGVVDGLATLGLGLALGGLFAWMGKKT